MSRRSRSAKKNKPSTIKKSPQPPTKEEEEERILPPTRETAMKLKALKKARSTMAACLGPNPPMDPLVFLEQDGIANLIRALPRPDLRQFAIREALLEHMEMVDEQIRELGEECGDYDNDKAGLLLAATTSSDSSTTEEPVDTLPGEVYDAVSKDNFNEVMEWLGEPPIAKERLNATCPKFYGGTLLHAATIAARLSLMKVLLQFGANVDSLNAIGQTPLLLATMYEDCSMALVLLEWGAELSNSTLLPDDREQSLSEFAKQYRVGSKKLTRLLMQAPLGGRRCEIVGLKSRTDLNGWAGVADKYFPDEDRYGVELDHSQEWVKVRTANLKRRDRTRSDPGILVKCAGERKGKRYFIKNLTFRSDEEFKKYQESLQRQKQKKK